MELSSSGAADRLTTIIGEFADLEPRERLELLLEFAEALPPLPARLEAARDAGEHRVHECQTPVYLWVELVDGGVQLHADVAPEAPTVKGFVSILEQAYRGAAPQAVLRAPPDLLRRLGLVEALGMTRTRGLQAILARVRSEVAKLLSAGKDI